MSLNALTLPRQSNPGRLGPDGAARLINCHAEDAGSEGRVQYPIYANAGWQTFAALTGQGVVRAAIELDGALYVVAGDKACKVSSAGEITVLGTVGGPDLTKLVTMARNRKATPQIGIVVDGFYYLIESDTLSTVTDIDKFSDLVALAHLDGYFVLLGASGKFQLTSIDDGSTISATDFSSASADPDGGNMVAVRNRDLILFGPNSWEAWQDTGGTFPFTRTTSATGPESGLLAPQSVATFQQTLAYVATDKTVRILDGYTPKRLSTHAVERAIAEDPDPAAITALAWTDRGHVRYEISGTDFTWTYDATLGAWTESASYGLNRSRARTYVQFGDLHIFGDYEDGRLYERGPQYLDESGSPIVCTMQLAPTHSFPRPLKCHAIEIDIVTGASATPGVETHLMLDWSDDGGKNFSAQRMISLGEQGSRRRIVRSNRLGVIPRSGRTFRLSWLASAAPAVFEVQTDLEALKLRGN